MEKELTWQEELISVGNEVYIMRYAEVSGYVGLYKYRVKLDNGQNIEMECFIIDSKNSWETYSSATKVIWNVFLYVTEKKKRGYEFLKQTGKKGIVTLLIAKEILKYHIDKVILPKRGKDHIIWINGDDRRRDRVYERGLRDLGFVYQENCSYNKENYGRGLIKRIKT